MSKIAKRVILSRLREKTQKHNVLPEQQFGFREAHATEHQVDPIVEYAAESLN